MVDQLTISVGEEGRKERMEEKEREKEEVVNKVGEIEEIKNEGKDVKKFVKREEEDWHATPVPNDSRNSPNNRTNMIGISRKELTISNNQNATPELQQNKDEGQFLLTETKSEELEGDNNNNNNNNNNNDDANITTLHEGDQQINIGFKTPGLTLDDVYIENYIPRVDKKKKILNAIGQWAGVTIDKETTDIVSLVATRKSIMQNEEEGILTRSLSIFWGNSMTNMREFLEQMTLGMRSSVQISRNQITNQTTNQPFIEKDFEEVITHEIYNPKRKLKFPVMEYAPQVFRSLREKYFNITEEEYVNEWTLNEEDLKAKEGAGRSGALFLFSRSRRFICKTIFKSEVFTLISFLQKFYNYVSENPNTLIMRLIGLYKFGEGQIAIGTEDVYVLVFGNVLWSDYLSADQVKLHEIYDLKGRLTKTFRFHEENDVAENEVRKDKHLSRFFYLGGGREEVFQQLKNDVILLRDSNLMDYSLLIGVHKMEENKPVDLVPPDHPCLFGILFYFYFYF